MQGVGRLRIEWRSGIYSMWRMMKALVRQKGFLFAAAAFLIAACSGDQFVGWQQEVFDETPVTESTTKEIIIGNAEEFEEQHLRGINFDRGSNAAGHFRIESLKVGSAPVGMTDVIIPPGSALVVKILYEPLNLETTVADYGGWVTGREERWIPKPKEELEQEQDRAFEPAIHRSLLQAVYDKPREGILIIELVGTSVPGPNGEVEAGGAAGVCIPGDGIACYTGGFAMDIPQLSAGGPKDLELTGPIPFSVVGGSASLRMDDVPPVLMYLRSAEIPELPPGISASLIISGVPGEVAEGTFDGSRLTLRGVDFRVRVVLGELQPEEVTPGLVAIVDFTIEDLELTTTEPLSGGAITLHIETTLGDAPSGNALFDQFLSGAKVIVIMRGQLAL